MQVNLMQCQCQTPWNFLHALTVFKSTQTVQPNPKIHILCTFSPWNSSIPWCSPMCTDTITWVFDDWKLQKTETCKNCKNWKLQNCKKLKNWKTERLKTAKITPVFKKGKSCDMDNYRPISVLQAIAKIIERTVYHQLHKYLQAHHLLSPYQHGFRQRHSTTTATIALTDDIRRNMELGLMTSGKPLTRLTIRFWFLNFDHLVLLTQIWDGLKIILVITTSNHGDWCPSRIYSGASSFRTIY